MKKLAVYIILWMAAISATAQQKHYSVDVAQAVWMPKEYLDARKQHPPEDAFWRTIDFSKYLSPVSSLRIAGEKKQQRISLHTYGAENFPINIKNKVTAPGRKEWILDKPIFSGGQSGLYEDVAFSLISHNNNKQDLWLGLVYKDGKKDSVQFEIVPQEKAGTPLWMHTNNYLAYFFKDKQFDVFDESGQLLYNDVHTAANGTLNGLPGYRSWSIAGNTFQLTAEKPGDISFASFAVAFTGADVSLRPQNNDGSLNRILVLKEKKQAQ